MKKLRHRCLRLHFYQVVELRFKPWQSGLEGSTYNHYIIHLSQQIKRHLPKIAMKKLPPKKSGI